VLVVVVVVDVVVLVVVVVVEHTYAPGRHSVVQTGVITPSTHEIEVTTSMVSIAPDVESVTYTGSPDEFRPAYRARYLVLLARVPPLMSIRRTDCVSV
jgi:hypothetical protein